VTSEDQPLHQVSPGPVSPTLHAPYEAGSGDTPHELVGRKGSCHCGAVRIVAARAPEWVGSCNCSWCTKAGWLVAYYPPDDVQVEGETVPYIWGDRMIGLHHCPVCGCGTHWATLGEDFGKMGVNARLFDGFDPTKVEVRLMDNR
jgi:hypothetical protein